MPEPINRITGVAASLPIDNVDTDMIWPAIPGASLLKGHQARMAFHRLRYTPDGEEVPDFILNRDPWREAKFLISGDNFGCGSSREMAVWALHEKGLRCVVAPRFGDIFYNNCTLNGLLPVRLERSVVNRLMELASDPVTATMTVDLAARTLSADGQDFHFEIDDRAQRCLLEGLDEIALTLSASGQNIHRFGQAWQTQNPWMSTSAIVAVKP